MSSRTPEELSAIADRTAADMKAGKRGLRFIACAIGLPVGGFLLYCAGLWEGLQKCAS